MAGYINYVCIIIAVVLDKTPGAGDRRGGEGGECKQILKITGDS